MDKAAARDIAVLRDFTELFCREHHRHGDASAPMCDECRRLLDYAAERRTKCPMNPKPSCKNCRIHCYKEPYRVEIRQVMKFGGMHLVKRGRVGTLARLAYHAVRAKLRLH